MEGQGEITFQVEERDKVVRIDVTDTGKGSPNLSLKPYLIPVIRPKSVGGG